MNRTISPARPAGSRRRRVGARGRLPELPIYQPQVKTGDMLLPIRKRFFLKYNHDVDIIQVQAASWPAGTPNHHPALVYRVPNLACLVANEHTVPVTTERVLRTSSDWSTRSAFPRRARPVKPRRERQQWQPP